MNETDTLQYLKGKEKSKILTDVTIKIVLSIVVTAYLMGSTPKNPAEILAVGLMFAVFYDLCCLFQFSLHLTRNYIVAFFVSIVLVGVILTLYNTAVEKYGFLNGSYSPIMEYVIVLAMIVVLLLPLIFSIKRIITLSRK